MTLHITKNKVKKKLRCAKQTSFHFNDILIRQYVLDITISVLCSRIDNDKNFVIHMLLLSKIKYIRIEESFLHVYFEFVICDISWMQNSNIRSGYLRVKPFSHTFVLGPSVVPCNIT